MRSLLNKAVARMKYGLSRCLLRSRARGAGFDGRSLRRVDDYLRASLRIKEPEYESQWQKPDH